jgi:hypothetical protein
MVHGASRSTVAAHPVPVHVLSDWAAKSKYFDEASFTRVFADSNVFACQRKVTTPTGSPEHETTKIRRGIVCKNYTRKV